MGFVLFGLVLSFCAFAGSQHDVVILFEYDQAFPVETFGQMQAELSNLMQGPGVQVQWQEKTLESVQAISGELIILRFQGRCDMGGSGIDVQGYERGALALTKIMDGEVLPFSDVDCNRVRASVRSAMPGYNPRRAEFLLGRALGRVVAHELLHILSKSNAHGRRGLMQRSLSGSELIDDHLDLAKEDVDRLLAKRNEHWRTRVERSAYSSGPERVASHLLR